MTKKLAELTVKKLADHYDEVVSVLENAGFIIVLASETSSERYYIIAKNMEEEK